MATIYHNCDHNDGCLAMISITDDTDIHYFRASDETGIADLLCMKIGDVLSYNNIPSYIEASSWCPMASAGEIYEDDAVSIQIVDYSD